MGKTEGVGYSIRQRLQLSCASLLNTSPAAHRCRSFVPGVAICSMRAAKWVVCPTAVQSMRRSELMARTTTLPELSPTRIRMGNPCGRKTPSAYRATGSCILQHCVARPHGVVLMGQRCPEEGHDPVAHHLIDRALVAVDGLHHVFEHRIDDLARLLRISIGEQLNRALEAGQTAPCPACAQPPGQP